MICRQAHDLMPCPWPDMLFKFSEILSVVVFWNPLLLSTAVVLHHNYQPASRGAADVDAVWSAVVAAGLVCCLSR